MNIVPHPTYFMHSFSVFTVEPQNKFYCNAFANNIKMQGTPQLGKSNVLKCKQRNHSHFVFSDLPNMNIKSDFEQQNQVYAVNLVHFLHYPSNKFLPF